MNDTARVIDRLAQDGVMSRHVLAVAASIAYRATRDNIRLKIYELEDVFQELIIVVLLAKKKGNYDPERGDEVDYYRKVMIRRLIELGERHAKMRLSEVMMTQIFDGVDEQSEGEGREDDFIDPIDVIEGVQSLIQTYEFVQTLSQIERDVIAYLMIGYTQQEIAKYLQFSQTKVCRIKKDIEMKLIVYADVLGYRDWTSRWLETFEGEKNNEVGEDIQECSIIGDTAIKAMRSSKKSRDYEASFSGTISVRF